ncbi:hypothetical protein PHELEMICH_73 [Mycobacterium phage Phelemich]|uniref:Uncharacterized protein n=2 Tax=Acadianvirus reprobate TaxID=1982903 RepID=S5Y7S9_9CAUD|nr:hypothetical protein N847_gp73 [Mycobacterium phage Phelemich]YP_008409996.1 hypothetical protein REPROBATE_75 [Mycobacterium phage Reprobate]AGT12811.1 hypothetical protein REPROBATE_75 [Mycobacterium phage Reprobate]AGT13987.1 hypothetical protein PHELEMICH_73 [Mycobacterium phage Phelemich]
MGRSPRLHAGSPGTTMIVLPDSGGLLKLPPGTDLDKLRDWCQGCDSIVWVPQMGWTDSGLYRCAACRGVRPPRPPRGGAGVATAR